MTPGRAWGVCHGKVEKYGLFWFFDSFTFVNIDTWRHPCLLSFFFLFFFLFAFLPNSFSLNRIVILTTLSLSHFLACSFFGIDWLRLGELFVSYVSSDRHDVRYTCTLQFSATLNCLTKDLGARVFFIDLYLAMCNVIFFSPFPVLHF